MLRRALFKTLLGSSAAMTFPDNSVGFQNPGPVTATSVVIFGTTGQLLVYSPTKGFSNLIASISAHAGTDKYGNAYVIGEASYVKIGSTWFALSNQGASLQAYFSLTAAGPWVPLGAISPGFLQNPGTNVNNLFGVTSSLWLSGYASGTTGGVIWLAPSGNSSQDVLNINSCFALGIKTIYLLCGTFLFNAQINVPVGTGILGAMPVQADGSQSYGNGPIGANLGTIIISNPGAGNAAFNISNTTTTPQGGQVLANFVLEGNGTPLGSGSKGIVLHGLVGAGVLDNVVVHRFDGPNLKIENDAGTGFVPDQWRINRCIFSASRSSFGVQIQDLPDSTITDCLSHGNALADWDIANSTNTKMIGCRGEDGAGIGMNLHGFGTAGQTFELINYGSELNAQDGILFDDGPTHAGSALGTYILTGCRSNGDNVGGAAAGSAYRSVGCKSRIMMTGCYGSGAKFGANETAISYGMALTGCYMAGTTAATNDDGTNTHALSNLVPVPF